MPDNTCIGCGWCCKLFIVNLSKEEYLSKQFEIMGEQLDDFEEAELRGFNLIAKKDDETCIYLDKNSRCKIYRTRPKVCREFSCASKEERFAEMIEKINIKRKMH